MHNENLESLKIVDPYIISVKFVHAAMDNILTLVKYDPEAQTFTQIGKYDPKTGEVTLKEKTNE